MNKKIDLKKYKIHQGLFKHEFDRYTQTFGKIEVCDQPNNLNLVFAGESLVEESENGEWIKAIDAEEVYNKGFEAGCLKTKEIIFENMFKNENPH